MLTQITIQSLRWQSTTTESEWNKRDTEVLVSSSLEKKKKKKSSPPPHLQTHVQMQQLILNFLSSFSIVVDANTRSGQGATGWTTRNEQSAVPENAVGWGGGAAVTSPTPAKSSANGLLALGITVISPSVESPLNFLISKQKRTRTWQKKIHTKSAHQDHVCNVENVN